MVFVFRSYLIDDTSPPQTTTSIYSAICFGVEKVLLEFSPSFLRLLHLPFPPPPSPTSAVLFISNYVAVAVFYCGNFYIRHGLRCRRWGWDHVSVFAVFEVSQIIAMIMPVGGWVNVGANQRRMNYFLIKAKLSQTCLLTRVLIAILGPVTVAESEIFQLEITFGKNSRKYFQFYICLSLGALLVIKIVIKQDTNALGNTQCKMKSSWHVCIGFTFAKVSEWLMGFILFI